MKVATICAGFKAGQSAKGGLGYERNVAQTINAKMSALEPTMVRAFTAKPGEMIRMSENPHMAKEISHTLTRSDGKLGDNQPTVIAFAQNTRDEVRSLGNAAGALSASTGSHQTNYISKISNEANTTDNSTMKAEVRRLTPRECERLMGFPENYTQCMGSDAYRFSACGNSWASNCARFVIKGIHKVHAKVSGK